MSLTYKLLAGHKDDPHCISEDINPEELPKFCNIVKSLKRIGGQIKLLDPKDKIYFDWFEVVDSENNVLLAEGKK